MSTQQSIRPRDDVALGKHTRLDSLTGLRFLAAILVVVHHCTQRYVRFPVVSALFYKGGGIGVTFFFLLSGFVLAWSWRPDTPVRVFYWRRFARIYPLHVVTWVIAGVILCSFGAVPGLLPALSSLLLLHAWHPDHHYHFAMDGPSWSLSCEAFFYAVFPFAVRRIGRHRRTLWRSLLIALIIVDLPLIITAHALFRHTDFLYTNPLFRLPEFLVGIGLGLAVRDGWRPALRLAPAAWLAGGVYCAIVATDLAIEYIGFFGRLPMGQLPPEFASLVMAPPLVLLIAAAARTDVEGLPSKLASRPMVRLGQWSFALYLSHLFLVEPFQKIVPADRPWPVSVALLILTVAGAVTLSGVLYTFVERPLESRLRPLITRGTARKPAAVADAA